MAARTALPLFVVAAILTLSGCQPWNRLAPQSQAPSMGYLQHRGTQHAVRDLLDPTYRAASQDSFVQKFDPHTCFADLQAERSLPLLMRVDR